MPDLRVGVNLAFAALIAFGLAGCADAETHFFVNDSQFSNADCRAVANDRANDAGITEDDAGVQLQVFQLTYANCISWHRPN